MCNKILKFSGKIRSKHSWEFLFCCCFFFSENASFLNRVLLLFSAVFRCLLLGDVCRGCLRVELNIKVSKKLDSNER